LKHIPIIFPISLAVIIFFTFFSGAYAISENALDGQSQAYTASVIDTSSEFASDPEAQDDLQWHERAAIWVCPLH
jgi:hypothetical protein